MATLVALSQSSSTVSNLALNKDVEVHVTTEQQRQAELNSVEAGFTKNSENLQSENKDVEVHITAEEQREAEQTNSLTKNGL